jgi:DNA-nicking Smr family endonuclease
MDFGDILDAWDARTATARGKKARPGNQAGPEGAPAKVDPLTAWLRINGVEDKDAAEGGEAEDGPSRGERRRRLLDKRPDAVIDLHGLKRDEAWAALEGFFQAGRQQGFEKLLIVHGKGNHSEGDAVLKRTCRDFIERCPFAGESGRGSPAEGASGATWVLIKPASS